MQQIYTFLLQMHIGKPSIPVVTVGDMVQRGQLLARQPVGALGSNLYSSVAGQVQQITSQSIMVAAASQQATDYVPLSGTEPLELIQQAGIVGLGGAGFPTYAKLSQPFCDGGVVIANASECEPVLCHNITAMEQDAEPVLRGLAIAMKLTRAARGVVAIKEIHSKAIATLRKAITDDRISLVLLPNVYPAGEERAVVQEVTGTLLPVGDLPLAAQAIVLNVETLCRIAEAVDEHKPFIDKDMTIAGKLQGKLIQVYRNIPIGLPVSSLLKKAGGLMKDYGELIMGGPFTGRRISAAQPVLKTTGAVIATETFLKGPAQLGLLACACGAGPQRLSQLAASMGSRVVDIQWCKQAQVLPNGARKCENPGHCPGQVQKVLALKKAGAQAILISNCTDCSNTVMACAPALHLPVYHCTDGALRAVNHPLIRKIKS
ncbi:MAG: proline reductase-associated electron transfer protein PrdC [Megasphaera sp.]|nr:proline reductase-associated electron transfer protein PrdC [Megasphaera sp.]MCH4188525.1 proline reductase-associated electron transfer protein PrdC [Megasphaera sp.]MCH4218364.1 proline reductase-associated electron transfer protein PrdC [Megasphaera sp.]